jgi:hypothetical protein
MMVPYNLYLVRNINAYYHARLFTPPPPFIFIFFVGFFVFVRLRPEQKERKKRWRWLLVPCLGDNATGNVMQFERNEILKIEGDRRFSTVD